MIAIKSNKDLYFPSGKGKVTMSINLIQNKPEEKVYEMRILDTCEREVTVDNQIVKQFIGYITRFKTMTYDELDTLYNSLNMDNVELPMREKINESFRQGLLAVTQKECIDGISGEEGKGQYYSEAQDWEIYRVGNENKFPEEINNK